MELTIGNSVFLLVMAAACSMIFAQSFKTILNSILKGKLCFNTLFSDGDFPSSHTTILISFNTVFWHIIYKYYIQNPAEDIFACVLIALVLSLWTFYEIRDAMGVRLRVQEQAIVLNQLAKYSKDLTQTLEKQQEEPIISKTLSESLDNVLKKMKLKAGHLPHEVVGGIICGAFIGSIFTTFIFNYIVLRAVISLIFVLYIIGTLAFFAIYKK